MAVNIESAKKDKITIFEDGIGEWRWTRVCTDNGKIVGASTEGYKNKSDCEDNAKRQFIECEIKEDK
jgi:uncharacterized protein YegP (UPF0339 family)